jgi:hypothetical protein
VSVYDENENQITQVLNIMKDEKDMKKPELDQPRGKSIYWEIERAT